MAVRGINLRQNPNLPSAPPEQPQNSAEYTPNVEKVEVPIPHHLSQNFGNRAVRTVINQRTVENQGTAGNQRTVENLAEMKKMVEHIVEANQETESQLDNLQKKAFGTLQKVNELPNQPPNQPPNRQHRGIFGLFRK